MTLVLTPVDAMGFSGSILIPAPKLNPYGSNCNAGDQQFLHRQHRLPAVNRPPARVDRVFSSVRRQLAMTFAAYLLVGGIRRTKSSVAARFTLWVQHLELSPAATTPTGLLRAANQNIGGYLHASGTVIKARRRPRRTHLHRRDADASAVTVNDCRASRSGWRYHYDAPVPHSTGH